MKINYKTGRLQIHTWTMETIQPPPRTLKAEQKTYRSGTVATRKQVVVAKNRKYGKQRVNRGNRTQEGIPQGNK